MIVASIIGTVAAWGYFLGALVTALAYIGIVGDPSESSYFGLLLVLLFWPVFWLLWMWTFARD